MLQYPYRAQGYHGPRSVGNHPFVGYQPACGTLESRWIPLLGVDRDVRLAFERWPGEKARRLRLYALPGRDYAQQLVSSAIAFWQAWDTGVPNCCCPVCSPHCSVRSCHSLDAHHTRCPCRLSILRWRDASSLSVVTNDCWSEKEENMHANPVLVSNPFHADQYSSRNHILCNTACTPPTLQ